MRRLFLWGVLAVAWWCGRASADDFFGSSPGALTSAHHALDDQAHCNDCHVNGSRDLSNDKCLACHDHNNLGARINAGKGFHSSALVKGKQCNACHHEHKGPGYDLMGWSSIKGGQDNFDHDLTGWPLNGAHKNNKCTDCHKTKDKQGLRTFMGTDRLCGSSGCHAKDQPHKFEQTERDKLLCERCHSESAWKPHKQNMKFDHNDRKDAAMPILGSHKDVLCTKCHPKAVFNLPFQKPDSCGNSGCHESPHTGHLFGARPCEWCHSPTFKSLKNYQNFDHSERTRFDLGTSHSKLKCYDCHTKALGEQKPTAACEQCHAKDSHHGDRFKEFGNPPRCGVCHPSSSWRPTVFNHSKNTKFPLESKHAQVSCRACHLGKGPAEFENFNGDTKCMDCHQHKNVHADDDHPKGKYKNDECLQCHVNAGNPNVKSDTKFSRSAHGINGSFPLVKGHKGVACALCHTGRDAKNKTSFGHVSAECSDNGCHADSLHKGTLGEKCTNCHVSGVWSANNFDHNAKFPKDAKGEVTSFPLKGAHKDNKCEACHPARKFSEAPTTCSADGCHADDDAHKGRLGKACEKCHVETGDNTFDHNSMSAFRLDGKHLQVRCADCHPSITFKPRPKDCFGCHPEPAVHKGQYGTGCAQCHSTKTWEDIKPLHDVGDFSLKGAHDNIACERCHRDNRPLAGSGNLCLNCHRQDDIHNNSLSPRCGECHTQWSFTPARFDHTRVGCNLTGIHRTIACADCHKAGNYAALSPQCVSCHHDDALKIGPVGNAAHSTTSTCANCHSINTWLNAPANPWLRESVCR